MLPRNTFSPASLFIDSATSDDDDSFASHGANVPEIESGRYVLVPATAEIAPIEGMLVVKLYA